MPDDDTISDNQLDAIGDSPAPSSGGSFSTWFQQHQRGVMVVGGITLVLTVYLIFRKSSTAGSGSTNTTSSGQPAQPGMTSDTASALNQQTTLLEALAQAVANLQNQAPPTTNPPPAPPPGRTPGNYGDLLAFMQNWPAQAQQAVMTWWNGLTGQQQSAFLAEPLAQQEQQLVSIGAASGTSGNGGTVPILPYNRENLPGDAFAPSVPTYPRTPYSIPPAAA